MQPAKSVEVEAISLSTVDPGGVSYPDFFDWRVQNRTLGHVVSNHDASFTGTGAVQAVHSHGEVVSWDFLQILGISPEGDLKVIAACLATEYPNINKQCGSALVVCGWRWAHSEVRY